MKYFLLLITLANFPISSYVFKKDYAYDLGSNLWASFSYDNTVYDYYVIIGDISGQSYIRLDFQPTNAAMDLTYILGSTKSLDLDEWINSFSLLFSNVLANEHVYNTYSINTKLYPYAYFAFHAAYRGFIYFNFKSRFTTVSTLAAYIYVLIVIGVLVCLALASMGIAKAMGRSPWEGLACFCIMCTICCCRR